MNERSAASQSGDRMFGPTDRESPLGVFVQRKSKAGETSIFDFRASASCGHLIFEVVAQACRLFPDGVVALNTGEFATQYFSAVQVFVNKTRPATSWRCRHQPRHQSHISLRTGMLCIGQDNDNVDEKTHNACFYFQPGSHLPAQLHLADVDEYLRQALNCTSYQAKMRCRRPTYVSLQLKHRPDTSSELDVDLDLGLQSAC